VTAFETGTNRWERLQRWPSGCDHGCTITPKPLYLGDAMKASFTRPGNDGGDRYVSDPAHPVPFRARPIQPVGYDAGQTWSQWLVDDQREASGRTDVLTYTSDVLTAPLTIAGQPQVHLTASTTGTDSDWVVKLIDVYPDEVANQPEMGGYQLAVAMDILRGRYREGFAEAKPIQANTPLPYTFALPTTNHVFLPGHRIMVQVQSSWFPLYDRNPQTFVPNIMLAKPSDYQKATQQVFHSSYVELPVVSGKGS
jgi:putative CocE/NonD family hydrolase